MNQDNLLSEWRRKLTKWNTGEFAVKNYEARHHVLEIAVSDGNAEHVIRFIGVMKTSYLTGWISCEGITVDELEQNKGSEAYRFSNSSGDVHIVFSMMSIHENVIRYE